MNKTQKKSLETILNKIDECQCELENMHELEEEKINNIPENLQTGEIYTKKMYVLLGLHSTINNLKKAYKELQLIIHFNN